MFVQMKSLGSQGPHLKGHICMKVYVAETFKNLLLMNHWPEYVDI